MTKSHKTREHVNEALSMNVSPVVNYLIEY